MSRLGKIVKGLTKMVDLLGRHVEQLESEETRVLEDMRSLEDKHNDLCDEARQARAIRENLSKLLAVE